MIWSTRYSTSAIIVAGIGKCRRQDTGAKKCREEEDNRGGEL